MVDLVLKTDDFLSQVVDLIGELFVKRISFVLHFLEMVELVMKRVAFTGFVSDLLLEVMDEMVLVFVNHC